MKLVMAFAFVLVASAAQAQYQWIGGLDVVVPVSTQTDGKGNTLPPDAFLGYDRDTGAVSLLFPGAACHEPWTWKPTEGKGAITHILQLDWHTFALYHESGFVRVEARPNVLLCVPVDHS